MKILVAIANYGLKNNRYLSKLLDSYRSMKHKVHIVILSNIPKDFGEDVEVIVGLPTKDPWSLPFGHKKLFNDRIDDYDLFIYSEDDTLIDENNINAFLNVTKLLPSNEIVGFLRYEIDAFGNKYCSTIHNDYHWEASSVKSVGEYTFAYLTNLHSACYILTQTQLREVIKSGGFLVPPHQGDYDLLCSAATDPYAKCGLIKVVCISHINDFMLPHLANQYISKMGLSFKELFAQIGKMLEIAKNKNVIELFPELDQSHTCGLHSHYKYYGSCREEIINLLPLNVNSVLSIGAGQGNTEARLKEKGYDVSAIPLDNVISASIELRNIDTIPAYHLNIPESLRGKKYDAILFLDILCCNKFAKDIVEHSHDFLSDHGVLIIGIPNPYYLRHWTTKHKGLNAIKYRTILSSTVKTVVDCKYEVSFIKHSVNTKYKNLSGVTLNLIDRALSNTTYIVAKKKSHATNMHDNSFLQE